VICQELAAGMDAVLSGPVAVSVDHAGGEKAGVCHLIASEGIIALSDLAVAEIGLVGAVFGDARRLRKSAFGKLSQVRGLRGLLRRDGPPA
jgi:hypothetical protein